jgi:hypothetical protein
MLFSQSLSFSKPFIFLPNAKTDKAFDITNFKNGHFVTWKDAGAFGKVHVCYLGKKYDTAFSEKDQTIANEETAFGPVLRTMNDRIYVFWISKDGSLKYVMNKTNDEFDVEKTYAVKFNNHLNLSYGVTAAAINNKIVIASHAEDKNTMLYSMIDIGSDGILKDGELIKIPNKTSPDYPFVIALPDTAIRFTWRNKDDNIYYANYNIITNKWSNQMAIAASKSKASPAVYAVWNSNRLFYIWKGAKNDNKIYYASKERRLIPDKSTTLPGWFSTSNAVSICNVDDKDFIMAYAGTDQKLYMSYFSNYNPASWMQDILMPAKSNYTLKDIAIPGSHDAGMSVLTASVGSVSGTINPCNTLTQSQNIAGQLNAGIRMFDLRAGTFNKQLYVKHSSSDCIDSAIGGGFGEKISSITSAINKFLHKNSKEIIILSFSHFCEKEAAVHVIVDSLLKGIGADLIFPKSSKELSELTLKELAGKVIITFENYSGSSPYINSNSISTSSSTFMNFRREYAATNEIAKMLDKQEIYFDGMKDGVKNNDIIRLDWQLTQSPDEAAMVCNAFEGDHTSVVVNSIMLLTNVARKHQSIIDLSIGGNKYLPSKINEWMSNGKINKKNKPNILYVDVAGTWITDYCIELNKNALYQK